MTEALTDRRLVLHVGPHKTASSFIQQNLTKGQRFLKKHGWIYPKEGTDSLAAHHHLAHNSTDYLGGDAPGRTELLSLAATAQKAGQNLIFSAEGFCRWKTADFEAFADLLGFESIELVYVIRDPLDVFHSFWSEEVKQGHSMGFSDRFAREFADPMSSRILNPMRDLIPLLSRSRIRLHIVPFDVQQRLDIDIYGHICAQVLGLADVTPSHVAPVNIKYPVELTEFLRLLTLMVADGKPYIGSDLRLRFSSTIEADERRDLVQLVKSKAPHARKVIKVPGNVLYKTRIEKQLKLKLKNMWTLDVEKEDLFPAEERKFIYYNEYLLWQTEPVRTAAEKMLKRLVD